MATRFAKMALTVVSASSTRPQATFPPQPPPLQSLCRYPGAVSVERTTAAPRSNCALQELPQSMPAGVLVTAPPRLGLRRTVRVTFGDEGWAGDGVAVAGGGTTLGRLH